jgi:ATP-dependent helicase/nuclease subunit A
VGQGEVLLHTLPHISLPPPAAARAPSSPDTDATRLGSAVHRVLEWASAAHAAPDLAALADAAAAEFSAPADDVGRIAAGIWRSPGCRRFFAGDALQWAGNEVPVVDEGELLRIDRLVHLKDGAGAAWWVLDYKLATRPEEELRYHEQMRRYRRAVMALQPGETVRCALINGQGNVIEIT